MLELPESYTISGQIKKSLTGKKISYIEVLHTPHRLAFFMVILKNMETYWKDKLLRMRSIMAA